MKIKDIHIDDYKVFKNFNISFLDSNNETLDLIVLAGINGSGKTTLFEFILEEKNWYSDNVTIKDNDIFIKNNKNYFYLSKMNDTLLKEYNNLSFIDKSNMLKRKIIYLEAKEKEKEDINIFNNDIKAPKKGYLKESIKKYIDTLIFEEELSAKDAYQKLKLDLKNIFDGLDMEVEFKSLDKNKNIFFENKLHEKISIDNLSTGEKELLNKIFYLYISDIKDSIIMIDEPEISLHPSWQNKIIKIYKNFAKQNNNQIIIATHSPQIIASTPNESLRVLVKKNNNIEAISLDAYGMNVNKALTEIMGVTELRDIEVQNQYDKVKNMILDNNYKSDNFQNEINKLETMMQNDNVDFGLLKLELLKREKNDSGN